MRARARNPFAAVKTAGLLLPVDLLARIVDADRDLPGLTSEAYHLPPGERLNEAASRAWNRCLAAWKLFRQEAAKLPAADTGTTLTRERWLLPLFQELGYGRLQATKAVQIEDKSYPISHAWGEHVPIQLTSFRHELDKRTPGVAGAATRSPYSMVQELLNRSPAHRWGFLSNGRKLCVLGDNVSLVRASNVEFDLEVMMDGQFYADFTLLFLVCHQSRVEVPPDAKPEDCWLEKWSKLAGEQGTRAREHLRDGVEAAIKALGAGFLTTRGNAVLRDRLRSGELGTQDYYRQLLRLVYRLLMLLVAEEKRDENGNNLLHPPDTPPEVRGRYARFYSVGRVRQLAAARRGTAHCDLYEALKVLFERLREGYPPLGIPGLGSFLFSAEATPELDGTALANVSLLEAMRQLCYTLDTSGRGGAVRRPVDFANLGSEELGSVYESLLELHPRIDTDEGPFTLTTAAGHERKTTGSYYTPTSLINCLLDSALDPVVEEALNKPEPEQALVDLKICDPACGSGHFLIAAAERLAKHLARLRTGDDEPSVLDIQRAKRDIIGRSIFGVDINPMAVELCKVSLWMEALTPGRPLSFLDAHVQCGNSLLGATPALLRKGIPDDAFKPIEGDDKKLCTEYRKQNRDERHGQKMLDFEGPAKPWERMGDLASALANLDDEGDDTVDAVRHKQERYAEIVHGAGYLSTRFWADTWCAAFVWKKTKPSPLPLAGEGPGAHLPSPAPGEGAGVRAEGGFDYAITEDVFRRIERNPHDCAPWMRDETQRLARQYQFFHWHLAFPQVFRIPAGDEEPENEQVGWDGGFDVVLGNPPWEKVKFQEKEWFALRIPELENAKTAAQRKRIIGEACELNSSLQAEFEQMSRTANGVGAFLRLSKRFPLCGRGDINSYSVFAETMRDIVGFGGRVGCIVPSGLATDDTTKFFFQAITQTKSLVSFFDFQNKLLLFADVAPVMKFALVTLRSPDARNTGDMSFVFFAEKPADVRDEERIFTLSPAQISAVNPNTGNCPTFRSRREAVVSLHIYSSVPVMMPENGDANWLLEYTGMFHMTNDSGKFAIRSDLEAKGISLDGSCFRGDDESYLPLYEAKLVQQFDHRNGTFEGISESSMFKTKAATVTPPVKDKEDASFSIVPRYWVPESDVALRLQHRDRGWLLVFRDIIQPMTNARCAIFAVVPRCALSNKLPGLLSADLEASSFAHLLGNANSFVFDFAVRQKIGGASLNLFILKQLPSLPPTAYSSSLGWLGNRLGNWALSHVLELTYTAWDLEAFALDCGYDGPPFRWNAERRFLLRCELDAAFFHLYLGTPEEWQQGSPELLAEFPRPRNAVDYIMETFPIVKRKDVAAHGTYRTKDQILAIYDMMAEAIHTGHPYQTLLDPPPGPPAAGLPDWQPGQPRPANWPPHIHPPRDDRREKR